MYARNIICAYVSKFSDLSTSILHAVEHDDFLTYALCGRAMIEATATLRYYVFHKYKPLLDNSSNDANSFKKLIEIDDAHLRGSRFDWESFLFRRYTKLKEDTIQHIKDKKDRNKKPPVSEAINSQQVNVLTCIEKWSEETPEVLIAFRGEPVGRQIFAQSFPILLSVTHKPFGEYLLILMGTLWQEDEL